MNRKLIRKRKKVECNELKAFAEQIKVCGKDQKKGQEVKNSHLVPSGSTLLNLACSDDHKGAFVSGTIVNIIGDTSAGKSFLALTVLAEICNNSRFDKYELFYDDVEKSLEFNTKKLFGNGFVDRVKLKSSTYAEEVGDILFNLTTGKDDRPFVYIVDSWDALKSMYEEKKEKINVGKRKRQQKEEGSFGDGKAKLLHKLCRQCITGIEKTNSLLIIISQTKDNWGADAIFNPKIVTGGNAIKFFPSHRIWLTILSREGKKRREIGVWTKAKIIKNKFTGKRRNIEFPIYYDYGIDDITSCVKFLISEFGGEHWKVKRKQVNGKSVTAIDCVELNVFLKEKALVKYIENNNLENTLRSVVAFVWEDIEKSILLGRKPKY